MVGNLSLSAKITIVLVDWDDNTSKKGPIYNTHKTRMDSDKVGESFVTMQLCVHDGTLVVFYHFFLLSIVYNQFASGLILCETAHSPVICGTPNANIYEFSPGGGDSSPCADPKGPPPWKIISYMGFYRN